MNELMVSTISRNGTSTSEVKDANGKTLRKKIVITRHPVGEILSVMTSEETRRTWLSVFCDLAAPAFQYRHPNGQTVSRKDKQTEGLRRFVNMGWSANQWDAVKACWSEELFDLWFKGTLKQGVARVADEIALWNVIEQSLDKEKLGKERGNLKYLCDVFPWNPETRKRQLILLNNDGPQEIKDSVGMRESSVETSPGVWEHIQEAKTFIDWMNDLSLSDAEKADIADPNKEINPDYSKLISKTLIKEVIP